MPPGEAPFEKPVIVVSSAEIALVTGLPRSFEASYQINVDRRD
jgi:hypothetical protein